jgi:hypothetical protein
LREPAQPWKIALAANDTSVYAVTADRFRRPVGKEEEVAGHIG